MDCRGVKKRLSAYLDREVDRRESEEIVQHINSCPDCTREMKALHDTCLLLREDVGVEPSQDFPVQLYERVRGEEDRYSMVKKPYLPLRSLPALARIAVVLILGIFIGTGLGSLTFRKKDVLVELKPGQHTVMGAKLDNFHSIYPQSLTRAYVNLSTSQRS